MALRYTIYDILDRSSTNRSTQVIILDMIAI